MTRIGGGRLPTNDDDDEDIDVEAADETSFGRPQYSEADVVPYLSPDEPVELEERIVYIYIIILVFSQISKIY